MSLEPAGISRSLRLLVVLGAGWRISLGDAGVEHGNGSGVGRHAQRHRSPSVTSAVATSEVTKCIASEAASCNRCSLAGIVVGMFRVAAQARDGGRAVTPTPISRGVITFDIVERDRRRRPLVPAVRGATMQHLNAVAETAQPSNPGGRVSHAQILLGRSRLAARRWVNRSSSHERAKRSRLMGHTTISMICDRRVRSQCIAKKAESHGS